MVSSIIFVRITLMFSAVQMNHVWTGLPTNVVSSAGHPGSVHDELHDPTKI